MTYSALVRHKHAPKQTKHLYIHLGFSNIYSLVGKIRLYRGYLHDNKIKLSVLTFTASIRISNNNNSKLRTVYPLVMNLFVTTEQINMRKCELCPGFKGV